MFHYQGSFPVKLECTITTLDKIDAEARAYEELYFTNQTVPEDNSDLVWVPFERRDEFLERDQQLINEFNEDASRKANQLNNH